MIEPIKYFIFSNEGIFIWFVLFGASFLAVHFYFRIPPWPVFAILVACGLMYEGMGLASANERISLGLIAGVLFLCGSLLYVFLCEKLLRDWAYKLTVRRGEKWVKEIDYLYLSLGGIGVLGLLNRMETLTNRYTKADVYAALILTSAIVLRMIKTRAEIGEWNKEGFHVVREQNEITAKRMNDLEVLAIALRGLFALKSADAAVTAESGRVTVRRKDKCLVIKPEDDGTFEVDDGSCSRVVSYAAMLDEVLD
jgi:hypothetical protein